MHEPRHDLGLCAVDGPALPCVRRVVWASLHLCRRSLGGCGAVVGSAQRTDQGSMLLWQHAESAQQRAPVVRALGQKIGARDVRKLVSAEASAGKTPSSSATAMAGSWCIESQMSQIARSGEAGSS